MTDDMLKADELWARMIKAREEYKKNKNKPKAVCVACKKELEWGGFAYNQELCWDCVVKKAKEIVDIMQHVSEIHNFDSTDDQQFIRWLTEIVAAHYQLPRPIF